MVKWKVKKGMKARTLMCVVSEVLYGTGIDCVLQIQFEYDCEHKLPHHAKPTIQKFHSQEEAP